MAGEIVEVQGGHIVRSTGRKDRHSKVCTAKGPRDRRVRLSAHTAIQFYDVQDRLGYDRPSKAVDWLIKKAKAAIDQLDRLPPWNPTAVTAAAECGILPPSLDSDAIADTIKSFFPVAAEASAGTGEEEQQEQQQNPHFPVPQFHDYGSHASQSQQDLRLSLQSFNEDPILLHHQNAMGFGWAEQHQPSQRIVFGGGGGGSEGGGFVFNSLHGVEAAVQPLFGRAESGQFLFSSQRGPLQSSNTPSVRASWIEAPVMPAMADHHHHHPMSQAIHHHNAGIGMGFGGGFSGFHHIPARIQGDEEHNGGNKPSSASSDSRH